MRLSLNQLSNCCLCKVVSDMSNFFNKKMSSMEKIETEGDVGVSILLMVLNDTFEFHLLL